MHSFLFQGQTILMETAERVMAEGNSDSSKEIGTNKQCIFSHPPTDVKGPKPLGKVNQEPTATFALFCGQCHAGLKAAKLSAECSSLPTSKLNHVLHVKDVQENLSLHPYVQTCSQCSISVHELGFQKGSSPGEQDGREMPKVKHQTQSILIGPTEIIPSNFFLTF